VQSRDGEIWIKGALSDANDLVFAAVLSNDKDAQKLLEQELLRSKFKLMQAVMSTTPDQVKWWRLRSRQNQRAEFLRLAKLTVLEGSIHRLTPIYAISSGEIRGFQLGNPNVPPYEAHLDLFDAADRQFTFDVMGLEGHGQVLTREEINAIVASIQSISDH
jgi:hypothetical protein